MSIHSNSKSQTEQLALFTAYHYLDIGVLTRRLRSAYSAWGKIPFDDLLERIRLTQGKCFYCGSDLTTGNCQLDHVIARTKGGAHTLSNVVMACKRCNQIKKNKPPEQFLREMGFDFDSFTRRLEQLNVAQGANESPFCPPSAWAIYLGVAPRVEDAETPEIDELKEGNWRYLSTRRRKEA